MIHLLSWLKEGVMFLAFSLLLIAGLLLIVVLVRPLMILAVVATLGIVVVSRFSPAVRHWLESPSHP